MIIGYLDPWGTEPHGGRSSESGVWASAFRV